MTISRVNLAAELASRHDLDTDAAAEAIEVYAGQLGAPDGDLSDADVEHIDLALQAHLAHDTGRPLDVVTEATERLRQAREEAERAERVWRVAIRAALADGQRVVDIAEAAGVSRERVYQIRDGRR